MAFARDGRHRTGVGTVLADQPGALMPLPPRPIAIYRVEPYVVAADVYAVPPHTGRGGWTWYTGSAGWMYRLITESLLGLQLGGGQAPFRAVSSLRLALGNDSLPLSGNGLPHHPAEQRQWFDGETGGGRWQRTARTVRALGGQPTGTSCGGGGGLATLHPLANCLSGEKTFPIYRFAGGDSPGQTIRLVLHHPPVFLGYGQLSLLQGLTAKWIGHGLAGTARTTDSTKTASVAGASG